MQDDNPPPADSLPDDIVGQSRPPAWRRGSRPSQGLGSHHQSGSRERHVRPVQRLRGLEQGRLRLPRPAQASQVFGHPLSPTLGGAHPAADCAVQSGVARRQQHQDSFQRSLLRRLRRQNAVDGRLGQRVATVEWACRQLAGQQRHQGRSPAPVQPHRQRRWPHAVPAGETSRLLGSDEAAGISLRHVADQFVEVAWQDSVWNSGNSRCLRSSGWATQVMA